MNTPDGLVAGRYRLTRVIASGGMGVVWEGWDEHLRRPVAIKQLHAVVGLSEDEADLAKRRALREARITARLNHRHAVPVFDAVEHEGLPYLVMPLLAATPLSDLLREEGPLPLAVAVRLGAEVASALAAAHELGIVHRDVKPGNILVTADGSAHLSDFGISHALGDPTLTGSGMVHGTPAYLAPEVARGQDATYASDVFSLGSTLYAAVEGEPPFGIEPNPLVLLHRVAGEQVRPPRLAGRLTPFLVRMLASEPEARPTMAEVAAGLAAFDPDALPPEWTPRLPAVAAMPAARTPAGLTPPGRTPVASTVAGAATPVGSTSAPPPPPPTVPPAPPTDPDEDRQQTRRRPVRALVVGLSLAAVLIAVGLLAGWFGPDPRTPDEAGGATTSSTPAATTTPSTDAGAAAAAPGATPATTPEAAGSPTAQGQGPTSAEDPQGNQNPERGRGSQGGSGQGGGAEDQATRLADAVTSYYALMPGDTAAAWPRMTADYRKNHAGGRTAFEAWWDDVAAVSVSDVEPLPPDRAEATLTYQFDDGRVVVERTAFRFEENGKNLRIAATDVLSSHQS